MANLRDVIGHICNKYPSKDELSKARLTKLVYLADWKMCLNHGKQISNIHWFFDHYGPYVKDIEDLARNDSSFSIEETTNYYGGKKELVRQTKKFEISLSAEEIGAIDFAIDKTKALNWDSFIKLIYSTHPIVTQNKYAFLDLPVLATEYKKMV